MRRPRLTCLGPCLLLALLLTRSTQTAQAENWPQWRGPRRNGIVQETTAPKHWSATEHVLWRAPLPGPGGATPVIWNDRIFVTSAEGDDLVLICFSTQGKQLWKQRVGTGNKIARGEEGNSASPSPCTDGKHVWVFFGTGDLACFDFQGKSVWQFNVQDRYGKFAIAFGMTSTPILHQGALYLQLIHGDMRSDYTVAKIIKLDANTGQEIWAVDRPGQAVFECKHSYASPILAEYQGQKQLITHGADLTVAFDPETGQKLWVLDGLNGPSELNPHNYDRTLRFVATPVFSEGLLLVPTAKRGPVVAMTPFQAIGRVRQTKGVIRWTNEKTPDVPAPLIHQGLAYFCRKDGKVFCVDTKTGEELYYERTHSAQHRASPILADGHLYLAARDGHVTVLKAGRTFQIAAHNDIGETITASPVIANGTLYLRSFQALYAIRE